MYALFDVWKDGLESDHLNLTIRVTFHLKKKQGPITFLSYSHDFFLCEKDNLERHLKGENSTDFSFDVSAAAAEEEGMWQKETKGARYFVRQLWRTTSF